MRPLNKVATPVKIIATVNFIAALLHILFWGLAFMKLPFPLSIMNMAERANMAITYGFGIADLIFSFPLLLFGAIGIWQLKSWGWLFIQLANVLWWYSFTVLLSRDIFTKTISPGIIIFLPFALFAFWAAYWLWKNKQDFFA